MKQYILAFDEGTTSARSILFDQNVQPVSSAQQEFKQYFPKPGWVEHDPLEIWEAQCSTAKKTLEKAGVKPEQIAGIGITNQRETTVVWNRKTGKPVYPAIVWQDRRTAAICAQLKKEGKEPFFQEATGLLLDPYFSGTKVKWILDNVDGARKQAENGELAFGTIDCWLVWQLTEGRFHSTEISNASRTLLYDIHALDWSEELLAILDIPRSMLPVVADSSGFVGETSIDSLKGISITGIAGDQQAALFGQQCFESGSAKNTYGTGCFLLMNTGKKPVTSKNKLLTTVAWRIQDSVTYALEGGIFMGGATIQWLRDELQFIESSSDVEALAASVESSEGVVLVPAFTGLGAPHWNPDARGTLIGMTRGTSKAHIARAALESIALQSYDLLKAMESDSGIPLKELRVDGGAANNNLLMQFQANINEVPVLRPKNTETTALGAALLAGLGAGVWGSLEDLPSQEKGGTLFSPEKDFAIREQVITDWRRAIKTAEFWARET
jgi:glycerol kinase